MIKYEGPNKGLHILLREIYTGNNENWAGNHYRGREHITVKACHSHVLIFYFAKFTNIIMRK